VQLDHHLTHLRVSCRGAVGHATAGGRAFLDVTLAAGPQAPARARHAAAEALERWDRERRERALLVISELVTNAVLHGSRTPHDRIGLRVARRGTTTRIEVSDPGTGSGADVRPGKLGLADSMSGWGLPIVAELTHHWGVAREPHRTIVWCELDGQ
jgi:anti-sigma regulatory factor (Ser/Thr protein kinase)